MKSTLGRLGFAIVFSFACALGAHAGLQDGLVLYYTFDSLLPDGSLPDLSGQGNNGTVTGASLTNIALSGAAMSFDGVDDQVKLQAANGLDFNYTNSFTISAWVYQRAIGLNGSALSATVIRRDDGTAGNWLIDMNIVQMNWGDDILQGDIRFQCGTRVGGNPNMPSLNAYVTDYAPSNWFHVCAVRDVASDTLKLYANGVLVGLMNDKTTANWTSTQGDIIVGAWPMWNNSAFNGILDDLRVYNRALSSAEVQELYLALTPNPPPPPVEPDLQVLQVQFSDSPDGDGDVTEFLAGETIYVRVTDVDATKTARFSVRLQQPNKIGRWTLPRNVTAPLTLQADGSFLGSVPLSRFSPGNVDIWVIGSDGTTGANVMRKSAIHIMAPVKASPIAPHVFSRW